jgi:hypothetical protein
MYKFEKLGNDLLAFTKASNKGAIHQSVFESIEMLNCYDSI